MAMMLKMLTRKGGKRVVTIEDPIEYQLSEIRNSLISQREVGGIAHASQVACDML